MKLAKDKLPQLWTLLAADSRLVLPVEADGVVNFTPWHEQAAVRLDVLNTVLSPKGLFFPPSETYMTFDRGEEGLKIREAEKDVEQQIVFGIRPCDVKAVELLDLVFNQEPADSLYRQRRNATTLVALGCNQPDPTCFCTAFQVEPGQAPAADVMLTDLGDAYLFVPQGEKGEALLEKINHLLQSASEDDKRRAGELQRAAAEAQDHGLTSQGLAECLDDKFDWDCWDELFHRCIGCGVCTFLCPTCHCFDMQDFSIGERGERFRCWDSCMFGEFTLHASGHNPRPTQKERVRQRFMHKLNYFPHNFGKYACVGCGRCVRKCPAGIDITQVMRAAGGVEGGC